MFKANVGIKNIEGFDAQFEDVFLAIDANLSEIAEHVKSEAKTTAEFIDRSKNLRNSIRKRKSRFIDGGYIVFATGKNKDEAKGYHAHLVEYGHVMLTTKGEATKLGRVPARPFMRKALESGIKKAISEMPKKSE